jgi:hypothetical protein
MITVVTLGRSASNWYCEKLSKENNYECLFENFHNQASTLKYFLKYKNRTDIVVKLIPYQWHKIYSHVHIKMMDKSEKVIFLIRKDYQAQMRSSFAGTYAKNVYDIEFHDEFIEPIIIPESYIDKHWESQIDIFVKSLDIIKDLYKVYDKPTKSLVYTEDAILEDEKKLNRPFIFEKKLWYPDLDYSVFEK